MRHRHTSPRPAHHRGFAIIEALIALLLFSLAVLGLVGLQASLARAAASAKYRAEAAYLASDLIGTMWAEAPNLALYKNCASHTPCSRWAAKVSAALPNGSPTLSICTATDTGSNCTDPAGVYQSVGLVRIDISWTVPEEGTHTYSTTTTITPNLL